MRKLVVGLFFCAAMTAAPAVASATVFQVDTTADSIAFDDASCSLREAVFTAVSESPGPGCGTGSGDDVIKLPAGTYPLSLTGAHEGSGTTGDLNVGGPDDLTIEPVNDQAKVTIDGLRSDRHFSHTGAGAGDLTLRNLTLTKGQTNDPEACCLGGEGGSILNAGGRLVLENVLLFDNQSAFDGGAIYNSAGLVAVNTTFSGNRANRSGGAIYNGDLVLPVPPGSVAVRSSTITLNEADANHNGTGAGGGIVQDSEHPMNVFNTIIAGNIDASAPSIPDCRSAPNFFPRHVISTQALGSGDCLIGFDPGTNQSPVDPQLEGLADNSGQTATHALPLGSPAIDAGADGSIPGDACPPEDARGVARPAGKCDIGAYERETTVGPPPPDPDPEPLPGRRAPTATVATFDGVNLHVRLKCPARFKPKCISTAAPVTAKRGGRAMGMPKRVRTVSNRWKRVSFRIAPAYRERVEAMTYVDRKRLIVKQAIRSKRVGAKRAKRPTRLFHTYKVRVKL